MTQEVVELLGGRGFVMDMTVGAGGHARSLLEAGVTEIVGYDRDPSAIAIARERLSSYGPRVSLVNGVFSEADATRGADGVLYDLGISSMQVDEAGRGFSYRQDGVLDMRMGPDGPSARDIVNGSSEEDLADIIFRYGGERRSRRVAAAIVRARHRAPIDTTGQLASVVASAVGRQKGGPHPARRTFQALRIAVNRELEELAASLPRAVDLLAPGGRVVVISYHSLEDGMVKRFFRSEPRLNVLTKHPLRPSREECESNPRARSAMLRAAERLGDAA
jgi:16S rRNA (cytosine1402-N4)-methyltransferase